MPRGQTSILVAQKHKIFADEYILTSDLVKSYKKAYNNSSDNGSRVRGYKLLQNEKIASYIATEQERLRFEREKTMLEAQKNAANINILKREEALTMLTEVARKQHKVIMDKYKDEERVNYGELMAFNATIERVAKFEGWDKAAKVALTDEEGKSVPFTLNIIKNYADNIQNNVGVIEK
jgi:hypothetical protein